MAYLTIPAHTRPFPVPAISPNMKPLSLSICLIVKATASHCSAANALHTGKRDEYPSFILTKSALSSPLPLKLLYNAASVSIYIFVGTETPNGVQDEAVLYGMVFFSSLPASANFSASVFSTGFTNGFGTSIISSLLLIFVFYNIA